MQNPTLDEREFELVNILGAQLGSNQRDLSRKMNLSLGMINMLIRRLINKGFIRIEQLNKRKVKYILTTRGFAEKMRKSVKYTLKTLDSIGLIKNRIKEILIELNNEGHRNFYVYCESDLATLIKMVFNEVKLDGCSYTIIRELPEYNLNGILLIGKENVSHDYNIENRVDLITEVSKANELLYASCGGIY